MTSVTRPFAAETVEDLLRRAGTPLTTAAIGGRFGWDATTARRHLKKLAAAGRIVEVPKSFHGIGAGNMIGWALPGQEQETKT